MHIWFADQGEPLPFQEGIRLQRYGELTRVVARRGHKVTWWASDFSHMPRGYIGKPNARVTRDGVEIVLVQGSADSDGYRPPFRNDLARHSDLKSPTIPE